MWVFLDYCYVNHCILLTLLLHNHTSPMMWLHNPVKWGSALVPRVCRWIRSFMWVRGRRRWHRRTCKLEFHSNERHKPNNYSHNNYDYPTKEPSIHPSIRQFAEFVADIKKTTTTIGECVPGLYLLLPLFCPCGLSNWEIFKIPNRIIHTCIYSPPSLCAYHLTVMKTGLGTVTCCWGSKKGCCSFNRIKEDVVFSSNDFIIIIIILTLARVAALQVINYYFISKIEFSGKLQLKMISSLNT